MSEGGSTTTVNAIVPSLRVDVLGARAFRVSRAWFSKGIASGSVSVNGKVAGKSATAAVGDRVEARELGVYEVRSVDGETKRGNLKVSLLVTRQTRA